MDVRLYTDENYVPLKDLVAFGGDFISKATEYRRSFIEVIQLNDFDFVNIVETPSLVKKRFSKNVELKGLVDIKAPNNDYILEIAKSIVKDEEVFGLDESTINGLKAKYLENGKDLTIVTNYLTNNFDRLIKVKPSENLVHSLPELTKYDVEFINEFNDLKMNYSISDYQSITDSSYETGRKSMDKLVSMKLYIKTKVGKKFVYRPTEKLKALLKGEK